MRESIGTRARALGVHKVVGKVMERIYGMGLVVHERRERTRDF